MSDFEVHEIGVVDRLIEEKLKLHEALFIVLDQYKLFVSRGDSIAKWTIDQAEEALKL